MEDLVKENMVLEEEMNALESDSVRENNIAPYSSLKI